MIAAFRLRRRYGEAWAAVSMAFADVLLTRVDSDSRFGSSAPASVVVHSAVIAQLNQAIQYAETTVVRTRAAGSWIPACAGMTAVEMHLTAPPE